MIKRYNFQNIYTLLIKGYSVEELRRFCFEHTKFRALYKQLSPETGKVTLVAQLMEYAEQKLSIEALLSWAETCNPAKYKEHKPYHAHIPLTKDNQESNQNSTHIFIAYKLDSEPDELIAWQVYDALRKLGKYKIFIDQRISLFDPSWAKRIESELQACDFLIVFISEQSAQSEMMLLLIETAHSLAKKHQGKPRILPVRLAYREEFPHPLNLYLDKHNWSLWRDHADKDRIINELIQAISGQDLPVGDAWKKHVIRTPALAALPEPNTVAQPLERQNPKGTINPQSRFYIEREGDHIALEAIKGNDVTITIKAPRQMGKSSLLMRLIKTAETLNKQSVFLDFQLFEQSNFSNPDTFYQTFCVWLSHKLNLPDQTHNFWRYRLSNQQRCTLYMEEYLLSTIEHPILLAMDELDILLNTPLRDGFFAMLRSWHNNRATDPLWKQLNLALVISTEPYLLIENLNQSPFNIGYIISLSDFTPAQVADLNQRHLSPFTQSQLQTLSNLLGGHPYLTRQALYLVASNRFSADDLFKQVSTYQGPFGDHLRFHALRLQKRPELIIGLQKVLQENMCVDEHICAQLRGAGLIRWGVGRKKAKIRCELYAKFFKEYFNG